MATTPTSQDAPSLSEAQLVTGNRTRDTTRDQVIDGFGGGGGGTQATPPAMRALIDDLALHERIRHAVREQAEARLVYQGAKVTYDREYYVAHTGQVEARRDFVAVMGKVYRDPVDATHRFEQDARRRSTEDAIQTLYRTPEAYGRLQTQTDRYALGFLRRTNDTVARHEAHNAAVAAITVEQRRQETRDVPNGFLRLHDAQERLAAATGRVQALPSLTRIERGIQQAVMRLVPDEMRSLQRMVTAPQREVLTAITHKMKEIALGRDGHER